MTEQFGEYRLDRLIGRGSAGEVWLAHDARTDRAVALKILSVTAAQDPDYRRRFDREASIGARLNNPHVVPIHTFGVYRGRLFLDMAYISGIDVARRLQLGAMRATEAVDLVAQVAQALDAAHAAGLVHRDVKPANIIVHASGFAYLIDFGIARATNQTTITATGFTIGTLAYMAPERFTGKGDARSDIYSLTCVLYECLTAQRPFGDTDPARQLHAHLHEDPPYVELAPEALNAVIARGMAKRPEDRYRTAGELAAAALSAIGMAQPIPRTPPYLEQSAPRPGGAPDRAMPTSRLTVAEFDSLTADPGPTRIMTETDPSEAPAHPNPTRVLATPNPPPTGRPELVRAPVPRRNPLLTGKAVGIIAASIFLLVLFGVVASCTELLSGGSDFRGPATSLEPTTSAAPTTVPERSPFNYTLTFSYPVPTLTFGIGPNPPTIPGLPPSMTIPGLPNFVAPEQNR
ncbi:serine/threonine-protein kinase [Nocardia alni]|uniref:serine/threonine-protein kinase n=1 Tax=Nocardia alni TaxID=2815723 RepID=UPI001C224022|nr:serine/threonine-protein kinase [Nocardia alni]